MGKGRIRRLAGARGHGGLLALGAGLGAGQLWFASAFPGWVDGAGSLAGLIGGTVPLAFAIAFGLRFGAEPGRLVDRVGTMAAAMAGLCGLVLGFTPTLTGLADGDGRRAAAWVLVTALALIIAAILLERRRIER